jgi:PLP dependent protein
MAFEFLFENLQNIQKSIAACCSENNLDPTTVTLLPVTKRQPLDKLKALYDLGERHFAENRVQEMLEKAEALPQDLTWHLIGPLQNNKVRQALKVASYIHSVDSLKLLERIERIAGEDNKKIKVFLQINLTEETQKSGFAEQDVAAVIQQTQSFENVTIIGLMTMGAAHQSENETSAVFARLKQLQISLYQKYPQITELSMGMSGDYKLAIPQGATYIRVGSLLLGNREY